MSFSSQVFCVSKAYCNSNVISFKVVFFFKNEGRTV